MATQSEDVAGGDSKKRYEGSTTPYVICIVCVTNCLFMAIGYEINIAGGVTAMDEFVEKFFPTVFLERQDKNNYCRYNNQLLQFYTSSLYLSALLCCMPASYTTRVWGRRASILLSGVLFFSGTCLNAAAQNLAMLICGRLLQGAALGISVEVAPLYTAEMAPAHTRGALMSSLEVFFSMGIFASGIVSYRAARITTWGWRLALGLAGVPGLVWVLGGIFLPDTPASMLQRGHPQEARQLLEKIRGTPNVDVEYEDIADAVSKAHSVKHASKTIRQRRYRPQMIVGLCMSFFFQFTGANAVSFYAPVFFRSLGFGANSSLYSNVIIGGVKVLSSAVAFRFVDKWGRKVILYEGGVQMFISLIITGALLQGYLDLQDPLPKGVAIGVVVVFCVYVCGFTWSWDMLGFVILGELFSLEIRPAGMSLCILSFYTFGFAIAQGFYIFLCGMRYGIFYFFAFWVALMTLFVAAFLPETKEVGLERTPLLWQHHWFWKRFVPTSVDVPSSKAQDNL